MKDRTETPEKLDLKSFDIADDKKEMLLDLFPEIRTEGGKVDFERLRLALGDTVDTGRERYGMVWPGKADCFKTIQSPSLGTLRPAPEESVNFDTTENLIIEGDNLEVLKLLQKSYMGKVKMIYIDPPYNTGKDFIYPDNYTESLQTYLQYTGQVDDQGRKFSSNTDTDGRFHSKWLNMMYPRLYLARNLLREDGIIFISINDAELLGLRTLLYEIFGEENFIGQLVWKNATDNNPTQIAVEHEYLLCAAKNRDSADSVWKSQISSAKDQLIKIGKELSQKFSDPDLLQVEYSKWFRANRVFLGPLDRYKYIDKDGVFTGSQSVHNPGKEGYRYDVPHPDTGKPCKQPLMGYRFPPETLDRLIQSGKIIFGEDENKIIEIKVYASEFQEKLSSVIDIDGRLGPYDLKKVFPESTKSFDNPKPVQLLNHLNSFILKEDDLVLDFFAGSGTTAHSILDINKQDGGSRKFILVQLPEPTGRDDLKTIADITKERVRRLINMLNEEDVEKQPDLFSSEQAPQDKGFKVFKLDESNFRVWDAGTPQDSASLEEQLDLHVDHVRSNRSELDILYEILLKSGFSLTTAVEKITLEGKAVYSIAGGGMLVCLEKSLTLELIREMASLEPARVVCLDLGFEGNDQLKTNSVQIFKTKNIVFRTV